MTEDRLKFIGHTIEGLQNAIFRLLRSYVYFKKQIKT